MSGGEVVIGDRVTYTAPPPAATSLHQIPPPPADFTGRERELAELREALRAGGATITSLRGAGGIGKTALAFKLAQELEPLYPDAQLYLDLKGVSPQPLTTAQAMAHVVRAYRPTDQLPESGDALAGLYHSVLHGQRVLLLMDNAASREQVEPLIPPAGCALLVTSRFHFTLPGIITKDLDELLSEDAEALLQRIAPRVGEAAAEIATLCGRLPLALRLAGSALAEKAWLTPVEYARRLTENQGERLGLIEASLATSYELLNEEQRARWRQLAVFPGTFDAAGAAAVWEMETDPARDALGELIGGSLVEFENERYRLHDLARVFTGLRLGDAEREVARRQHAGYYARVLFSATVLYLRGGPYMLAGLALFDAECGNLKAGQAWAASRAAHDAQASELCSRYPDYGSYCLYLRLHPREWIAWLDSALAAARRAQDRGAEGHHLGALGVAYQASGELRRAIEHLEQWLTVAREMRDLRDESGALSHLGLTYFALGEPLRAIEHLERALIIDREIGDRRREAAALGALGRIYADLGEPQRAIEHCEESLIVAREFGNLHGEVDDLISLGLAYTALGEPRRAIENCERAVAIAREIGDRRGEGSSLGQLGNAYADLGNPRRALEHYERWLAIAREIGDRREESAALSVLGTVYLSLGEPRRAMDHYEQQLAIAREIGDRGGEATACWNFGLIHELQGHHARAAELMQVLVAYQQSIGHPDAEKHAAHVAALRARIK